MRLLALTLLAAAPVAAQRWRPEDRVVLRAYSVVEAVAATESYVFAATRGGLLIRDRRFRRWLAPRTADAGYPTEPVIDALADPVEDAVWLATASGVVRYVQMIDRFERLIVPGGVRALAPDPDDPFAGIWIRTASGWQFLPRGGIVPIPRQPPRRLTPGFSLDQLRARYPFVETMGPQAIPDDRLRTFRFTAVARVPRTDEYWLGTDGGGLVRLDAPVVQFERMPFGLLGEGVGGLLAVPGGVWVATDGFSPRQGFTFVSDDLDRWRWEEGPAGTGFGVRGFAALLQRGRDLWAATSRGVWRQEPGGFGWLLGTAAGLPEPEVFALAQGPAGVWVGTSRGLALVPDTGGVHVVDHALTVLALSAARDTVWVGTTVGLGVAWPGADRVLVSPDVEEVPQVRGPVVGVSWVADTLVAVTTEYVVWRAGAGPWQVDRVSGLGTLTSVTGDAGGVWLGGARGFAWFAFGARAAQLFNRPDDVPGPVRRIVEAGDYVWVGTERGLVRFRKDALVR